MNEVGVRDNFPLDKIKVLLVPIDKFEFIKKLSSNTNIIVIGINNFSEKFYYVDDDSYQIYIDYNKYNEIKNNNCNKNRVFSCEEIENLISNRKLSSIRKALNKINIK